MANTTAVLMAAGAGTRLGHGPKALLPFRGGTLVEHAAAVLRDGGCSDVVVVVGAGAAEVAGLQQPGSALSGLRLVRNDDWASGMGGSFRLGVESTRAGHNVLVALVDQPGVSPPLVARLIAAHRPGRITAAGYGSGKEGDAGTLHRGHPIIFDPALAARAATTSHGDAGARDFLRAHPGLIDLVDCIDLFDGADLDTESDLHLLDGPPASGATGA
ncbi:molybdenum cofactor cytidylyltransferase [Bacillus sp. SRB_336]|nr:molybdenum cofactor cytidylyltransferase [Bacillus sp. SRB_336]